MFKSSPLSKFIHTRSKRADTDPLAKKVKTQDQVSKVKDQLDSFVQAFMNNFIKRLAIYYITAKGERLTAEALKAELKTGFISSLIDFSIAQIGLGSLPSLANSIRTLSSQYYLSREKAQRITKAFETVNQGALTQLLGIAAVEIFQSFEMQFMHVTDKAGDKMAMEKLGEDAAGRALNYIAEGPLSDPISSELITKAIILGNSEKFFDPNIKKVRIRISGNTVQDSDGNSINTANLYEKTGLMLSDADNRLNKFYRKINIHDSAHYGYRRVLNWEKADNNELDALYQTRYRQETVPEQDTLFQYKLRRYSYCLQFNAVEQESERILSKYKKIELAPSEIRVALQTIVEKPSVLFDLRKPVENFTGRTALLKELHQGLISGKATVIVAQRLSSLSINTASTSQAQPSHLQTAICGLGGIGKTQLALRYAKLYAEAYDQNVLWINAETKVSLANSLKKLANKLNIATNNRYGVEKELEDITEEIYAYFSTGKSLFIFDNVESYREIDPYLPKVLLGNQPTILLTSRYKNWKNIANIISVDVFTEAETMEFIKRELTIQDSTQDGPIKTLHHILQGLPLVLQQAMAYINNQRDINSHFSINDYIQLYQEKSQELLDFNLSNYSNDPYTKTVLITWQVTLDKIKQDQKVGGLALEILNIMAFICPDNIANSLFLPLHQSPALASAIHLLKSYSMINQGSQQDVSNIHRLVQQVTRIQLERNPNNFKEIAEKTIELIGDYTVNKINTYHFIYLLLHMNQHLELAQKLNFRATQKRILDILTCSEYAEDSLMYWLDTAQLLYPKKIFINFLGEALFAYMHYSMVSLLSETINYIEKKFVEGMFSKDEIREILDVKYQISSESYKKRRRSSDREENKRYFDAIRIIYEFEHKLFPPEESGACSSNARKKRNIGLHCLVLSEEEIAQRKLFTYQSIQQHLQKVSQIARFVSTGIFSKDTLSALIQGNFSTVAINFGLVSTGTILGEISNKLLTQGQVLSSTKELLLLEKNVDLNAKMAISILTNEEVLDTGRRIFLGNAMKMASPFVARGTSVFVGFRLIQLFKNHTAGNKEELHEMTSNGIIVGVDGIASGIEAAEYLEVIEGVSVITGPLGEAIVGIVWLESDVHHVEQQVSALQHYVHLSKTEKLTEDIRAFLHFDPSAYLETKALNNQRVNNAIAFLKKHTTIQRYVFATAQSSSQVFLDKKIKIILNEEMPDAPNEGDLFCLSGKKNLIPKSSQWVYIEPYPPFLDLIFGEEVSIYLCENALGVEYPRNRTGNVTLIGLGEGDSTVVGGEKYPTVFLINQGKNNIHCNAKDCLFLLQGQAITGTLSGGPGVNLLNLEDFYPQASDYALIDAQGFVCGKNSSNTRNDQECTTGLELKNVQHIHGRANKKDVIYIANRIENVDAFGGNGLDYPDHIYVTNKSSNNLKIILRTDTVVHCLESNISTDAIDYKIPNDQAGVTRIQLSYASRIKHRFYFDYSLEDLKNITLEESKLSFNFFHQQQIYQLIIEDPVTDAIHHPNQHYPVGPSQAYYLFKDNTEIKLLNKNKIYAQQLSQKSIAEIMSYYPSIARRLNLLLSIQLDHNEIVLIGHGKHALLYNNALAKSHLLGNGAENIYIIRSAVNNSEQFPVPQVTIYNLNAEYLENTDTLDLRYLVQQARQQCSEQRITHRLIEEGQDLILSLHAQYYPIANNSCIELPMSTWSMASIRLKDALQENWYQLLDVILYDNRPMNIIATSQAWRLEQQPLFINSHKEIIVITEQDVESEPEIFIVKSAGEYSFFRNGNDLYITNALDPNTTKNNFWTVLFHQAYEPSKIKLLSTTLNFIDKPIVLNKYQQQINNAKDFHQLFSEYNPPTNSSAIEPMSVTSHFPSERPHLASQTVMRRKRQVDNNPLSPNLVDRRIDAMADQYLERYDSNKQKQKVYRSKQIRKKDRFTVKVAANSELPNPAWGSSKQKLSDQSSTQQLIPIANQKFQKYSAPKKIQAKLMPVLARYTNNTLANKKNHKISNFQAKSFSLFNHQRHQKLEDFSHLNYLTDQPSNRKRLIPATDFMKPRLGHQQDSRQQKQMPAPHLLTTLNIQGLLLMADVGIRKKTQEKYRPVFSETPERFKKAERQLQNLKMRTLGYANITTIYKS